eukprot:gene27053-biopygen17618
MSRGGCSRPKSSWTRKLPIPRAHRCRTSSIPVANTPRDM